MVINAVEKVGQGDRSAGAGGCNVKSRMDRENFTKMPNDQKAEGNEGTNSGYLWEGVSRQRENVSAKALRWECILQQRGQYKWNSDEKGKQEMNTERKWDLNKGGPSTGSHRKNLKRDVA